MHFVIDDDSKALLLEVEDESKESINCGNIAVDDIDNNRPHSTCSNLKDETVTVTQENEAEEFKPDVEGSKKFSQVPHNTDHDDVKQDEDLAAKDLLCFAWQIACGMVST